jgi:hypothetical protein
MALESSAAQRPLSETKALPDLHISGIMCVSLENGLQRSSIQASDQAVRAGLAEEAFAQ